MLFQCHHAVAASQHEELIQGFEQLIVGGLIVGRSLQHTDDLFEHVDEHLLGSHNNHGPKCGAADDDELRHDDERAWFAASHHEAAENGGYHYDGTNDGNHDYLD